MYISSQNLTSSLRQSVMQTQSSLATAQSEVASGIYSDLGLQLGGSAGSTISLAQQSSHLGTLTTANVAATTRLTSTSSAIDSILSDAQSMSNALITTGSASNLSAITQTQAQTSLQAFIAKLNTAVGGQYIFAGTNTAVAPMSDYATTTSKVQAALASDLPDPATATAADIDNAVATGEFSALFQSGSSDLVTASTTPITSQISSSQSMTTSVSANQSAFQDIAQAYSLLSDASTQSLSSSASQAVISSATQLLNSGISALTTIQANIGTKQNTITSANDQMAAQQTILTSNVASLENVDTYTLSTKVSALQTQLQDAYSLTSQLKSLSLVNYLTGG